MLGRGKGFDRLGERVLEIYVEVRGARLESCEKVIDYSEAAGDARGLVRHGCCGCKRSGRSTSGGGVMVGSHCIKSCSRTQETIAFSSGEFEFYGLVRAAAGLGAKGLLEEIGGDVEEQVNTWSSG